VTLDVAGELKVKTADSSERGQVASLPSRHATTTIRAGGQSPARRRCDSDQFQSRAHAPGKPPAQGQTEPDAVGRIGRLPGRFAERPEQPPCRARRDARTVIADLDPQRAGRPRYAEVNPLVLSRGGVLAGVIDKVQQHLLNG